MREKRKILLSQIYNKGDDTKIDVLTLQNVNTTIVQNDFQQIV